jgi:MYXO-CTERM domain-containing protein
VEIPFTSGGAGCAVGRRGGSPLEAAGLVGLLWILARRRRAAS